jgi:hypothetical protein
MKQTNMNRIASTLSFGLAFGLFANGSISIAGTDSVTTTKTTSYSGTVSEIDPARSTIVLRSETATSPTTYTYTKETTFVDANGNVVSSETIRNAPVTVEYSTEGGQTIVRRVVQTAPAAVVPAPAAVPVPSVIHEKTTTHTETKTH